MHTPDTFWDLFTAYSIIWLCIAGYLFRLLREQSKLADELRTLRGQKENS